jgi:Holliday junction resolvase RusA-like endonuclease
MDPPPTHQAALRILKNKAGKMFVGKMSSSSASRWKDEFNIFLSNHAHKPDKPMDGPLRMSVHFAYPLLKEHLGKVTVKAKITRPDCDNLVKMVMDCLTEEGYIVDDSRVVHLSISKSHDINAPFVDVIITEECNNPFLSPETE